MSSQQEKLQFINGMPIHIISDKVSIMDIDKQIIFPKRKNKRIQARYRNNKKYWGKVKQRYAFTMNNAIYMDELTLEAFKKSGQILETK